MSFSDFANSTPSQKSSSSLPQSQQRPSSSSSSQQPLLPPRTTTTSNRTPSTTILSLGTTTSNNNSSSSSSSNDKGLITISDALLQYQRNVGILEKIVQSLGTPASSNMNPRGNTTLSSHTSHWNETIAQYEAQNHVLQQLEDKLKVLLQQRPTPSPPPPRSTTTTTVVVPHPPPPTTNTTTTTTTTTTAMIKLQRDFERVQMRVQQLQDLATTQISNRPLPPPPPSSSSSSKSNLSTTSMSTSHNNTMPFFFNNDSHSHPTGEENDAVLRQYQQQQLMLQQEDRLQEEIMREREEEIRNINQGMHTVHEIYKDLAHMVSQQQHDIDTIETQMDQAHTSAQQGLQQVEKANEKYGQGNCSIM